MSNFVFTAIFLHDDVLLHATLKNDQGLKWNSEIFVIPANLNILIDLIQKQIKKGKIIVNLSQCIAGKVDQSKYETGRQLESVGVIGAEDMTFEALISKSMLLLKKYQDVKEISKMLLHPLSGEISTLDTWCLKE